MDLPVASTEPKVGLKALTPVSAVRIISSASTERLVTAEWAFSSRFVPLWAVIRVFSAVAAGAELKSFVPVEFERGIPATATAPLVLT